MEIGVESCVLEQSSKKRAKKGGARRPFSHKAGAMRSA
jgi:hypothetical protein